MKLKQRNELKLIISPLPFKFFFFTVNICFQYESIQLWNCPAKLHILFTCVKSVFVQILHLNICGNDECFPCRALVFGKHRRASEFKKYGHFMDLIVKQLQWFLLCSINTFDLWLLTWGTQKHTGWYVWSSLRKQQAV